MDRPSEIIVRNSAQNAILERKWLFYDGQANGQVGKGNLTRSESWLDQDPLALAGSCTVNGALKCAVSSMTYDGRGLVIATVDPLQRTTSTSYDADGLYPSTVIQPATATLPNGLTMTATYDPLCGKETSRTEAYVGSAVPGMISRWRNTYDSFCRLETVYRPGEDSTLLSPYVRHIYKLGALGIPTVTVTHSREPNHPNGQYIRSSVLADGFGRVIQAKAESVVEGAMKVVATSTAYDDSGNLRYQYLPVPFADGTSFETYSTTTGAGFTKMSYDTAGRLTRVDHADNTFRTIDPGTAWQVTTKDECFFDAGCIGVQTVEKRDALGNVIENIQTDEGGSVLSATKFDYDELNRVRVRTQGNGSTWTTATAVTTTYDSLGRTLSIVDPDSGPSGSAGTWLYRYDAMGNLRYADDPAANRHVQFCYDELGRTLKKKYFRNAFTALQSCSANASEQITYEYDAAVNGAGKLYRVTDLSGQTMITKYTPVGQLATVIRIMDGVNGRVDYVYDSADHMYSIKYPDGELVRYAYDGAGRVSGMANGYYGSPIYLQGMTYDVFGRPRVITHGNGTIDTHTYETTAAKNFRLKQIKATTGAVTHFRFDYADYYASGRLKQIDDTTPTSNPPYPATLNATASLTYDGIGRLLSATGTSQGVGNRNYSYNYLGNITSTDGTTIVYGSAKPHVPTSATGALPATFQHDLNGNRSSNSVSGGPYTYYYDLDDRLRLIDAGVDGGAEFMYDSEGRRTREIRGPVQTDAVLGKKVQAGSPITYHYTEFLEVTGDTLRKYYFADGMLIASRETDAPPSLVVASVENGGVQFASVSADAPRLVVSLDAQAARTLAFGLAMVGGLLVLVPRRGRTWDIGLRARPADVFVLTLAVTFGMLPWPLMIRPTLAGGGSGPTPTPVPVDEVHHYHLDHLGSPQVVTKGNGDVVKQIRYAPYGAVRAYTIGAFSDQDDRLFTGYQQDPLSGHYYAGARFYDPDFGLFLTHDPARQFPSPYTYTNWNPIGRTDPTGAFVDSYFSVSMSMVLSSMLVSADAARGGAPNGSIGATSNPSSASAPSLGAATLGPAAGTQSQSMLTAADRASGVEGSSGSHQALGQGANAAAAAANGNTQGSAEGVAAVQGIAKFVGVQSARAGDVRAEQDALVRALDRFDETGRSAIKEAARAQSPLLFQGGVEYFRPGTGPRSGSVGRANIPNPYVSAGGAVLRVGGRVVVGVSLVIDAGRVYFSPDRVRTATQVGFGTLGAFGGGAAGALGGSAFAPGPGTLVGGLAGAASGGAAGEYFGGRFYDFVFK